MLIWVSIHCGPVIIFYSSAYIRVDRDPDFYQIKLKIHSGSDKGKKEICCSSTSLFFFKVWIYEGLGMGEVQ